MRRFAGVMLGHAKELGHALMIEEIFLPHHARKHGPNGQHAQRHQHHSGAFMGMFMGVFIATRRAEKGQEHQAPAVETGKERGNDQHPKGIAPLRAGPCAFDDCVFRQKPSKADIGKRNANTGDGQRADHHRPIGVGQLFAQPAVIAHVLLVMHPMDDRTRAQKQHRFEKRVRQQVEHGHRIHANTRRHKHIAQLATGRIGDHAFDIVLHKPNSGGKKCSCGPQIDDKGFRLGRVFVKRRHAADQKHTRCHHGGGVDQGRNRGWALHRVRQPCVQNQLCRFPHCADEQQHRQQVCCIPFAPQKRQLRIGQLRACGKDGVKIDCIGQVEQAKNTQGKAKITHPVHHKGLDRRGIGRGFFVIKPDQQIRGHAHAFPAKEHLHQVIRCHQHQHGKGKERQIGKKARFVMLVMVPVVVMGHVAKAIKMHQGRNAGHNDQHDRGQPVQANGPGRIQRARADEIQNMDMLHNAGIQRHKHHPRQQARQKQQPRGNPLRGGFTDHAPAKTRDKRANQRRKKNDLSHGLSLSSR